MKFQKHFFGGHDLEHSLELADVWIHMCSLLFQKPPSKLQSTGMCICISYVFGYISCVMCIVWYRLLQRWNQIPLASICIRSFMRSSSSPSSPCFARSFRSSCRFGWFLLVTSRSHRPKILPHPPPTLPFCVGVQKASDLLQNELVPCHLRLFCCSALLQNSAFLRSFLAKQLTKSAPISAPLEKIPPPTRMAKDTLGVGICGQKLGSPVPAQRILGMSSSNGGARSEARKCECVLNFHMLRNATCCDYIHSFRNKQ